MMKDLPAKPAYEPEIASRIVEITAAKLENALKRAISKFDDRTFNATDEQERLKRMAATLAKLKFSDKNDHSSNSSFKKVVSPEKTENELEELRKAICCVTDALLSLHAPALRVLFGHDGSEKNITELEKLCGVLNENVLPLLDRIKDEPRPDCSSGSGKGRPSRTFPTIVAKALAGTFFGFTWRDPAITVNPLTSRASGPYLDLVAEVFGILRLSGSPEHYAKKAITDLRKEKKP